MFHLEWEILVIAIFCEILGTASGFGSSILFLPLAQYYEPPHLVMVLTAVLHVFANGSRVYLFWESKGLKLLKKLAPAFLLTSGAGALLSVWTSPPSYKLALASLLIIFALFNLLSSKKPPVMSGKKQVAFIGAAGLLTGWIGTGAAIRAMVLSTLQLNKLEFIFVSSSIDLGGDSLRSVIYLLNGYMEMEHVFYIPALALCAWIGSRVGKVLVKKIPQSVFERFVLVIILIVGIVQIGQFFFEKNPI